MSGNNGCPNDENPYERALRWVKDRETVRGGERLNLSEGDVVSLSALWRVVEATRVLRANVGRTTGPMWSALDRAFDALDGK